MSTSKVDTSGVFQPVCVPAPTLLSLSMKEVAIRANGIEFLSPQPRPLWTEMTVELRSSQESRPVRGTGVVVDCTGSRATGYVISLMLTNLTRQSRERLSQMAALRTA